MSGIEGGLRDILVDDLFVEVEKDGILPTYSLRNDLGIDSLGFIELRVQVEKRFGISISDDDFTPENFSTLSTLTDLIHRQRGADSARP